jgi:hypothetical protein
MSLHARLYAARAARSLQEQEQLAEELRGDDEAPAPAIPAPRAPLSGYDGPPGAAPAG